jgi:hypothetical protein
MRFRLPFISTYSHREVIAAKDETIALQRETIKQLTDSLEAFRETMTAVRKAAAEPPRRVRTAKEEAQAQPIRYEAIDPSDWQAVLDAAAGELGPGKHTSSNLIRRAEAIRQQIINSRAHRASQPAAPLPTTQAPPEVNELIEQAVQQGIAAAAEVI